MATRIVINRKKELVNKVQSVKVFIDNSEMAPVANGSSEEYLVNAGTHTIQGKVSWFKSQELTVQVNEGETKFISVRSGMKYYTVGYVLMLVVLVASLLIRGANLPNPGIFRTVQVIAIMPFLLYILYYFTIGRKKYLLLEEDKEHLFR